MIKGLLSYLKYSKLYLIGFLISCFILLGSSVKAVDDSNSLPYGFYTQSIYNTITPALNFSNSENNGKYLYLKAVGGEENNYYAIFWNNGKLYNYRYLKYFNSYSQGYFNGSCKYYSQSGDYVLPNCNDSSEYTVNNLNEFYNLSGYNFSRAYVSAYGDTSGPKICFYNQNNKYYYCMIGSVLTGSIGIPNSTTDFTSYSSTSEFNSSSSPSISDDITVNFPTVGQLVQYYNNNGFYSGMCYSSSKIYSGGQFVSVDSKSILELFSSSEDFVDSLSKFSQYCESSVYGSSACSQAFQGEDLRFNIISKLPTDLNVLGGRKQVYRYCQLLTINPNTSTAVLTGSLSQGVIGTEFNQNDVSHSIINGQYTVVVPNSGSVYSDLLSGDTVDGNIFSSRQRVFSRITGLFSSQQGSGGFIPSYILLFLSAIILFKLFRK